MYCKRCKVKISKEASFCRVCSLIDKKQNPKKYFGNKKVKRVDPYYLNRHSVVEAPYKNNKGK